MFKIIVGTSAVFSIVLVLFVELLPVPFGGYADQRFLLILLFPLLMVSGLIALVSRRGSLGSPYFKSLWPYLLLSASFLFLAFPYACNPYAWVEPGMYAFYFLVVALVALALVRVDESESFSVFLVYALTFGCFLYAGMTINVYLFALFDGVKNFVNYIPWGFVSIRYWSHVATWVLPILPIALLIGPFRHFRLWQSVVILGAGLWWWIIFLSTARGSAIGIVFGTLLVGLLIGKHALPWLKGSAICFVAGIACWAVLSVAIPFFSLDDTQMRPLSTTGSGRLPLFYEAWRMSLQNFPFGMGPQSWLTHEILTEDYGKAPKFGHPHNMYLMWAAEYGWVLIVGLLVVVGQAVRAVFRRRKELVESDPGKKLWLLSGFTASVSGALIHAGASAVFVAPGSMLVGLFVLAAFLSLIIPSKQFRGPGYGVLSVTKSWRSMIGGVVICLVVGAWAIWFKSVWSYYVDMRADEKIYQQQANDGMLPRFWFHGNFPRR